MKDLVKKSCKKVAAAPFAVMTFFLGVLWIVGEVTTTKEGASIILAKNEPDAVREISKSDTEDLAVTLNSTTTESSPDHYDVVKVVDGDTIDVAINGKVERIRMIGINTPETVDPRKPVECFGVEASNKAKELLNGKKVTLESDPSQGERDKYDRLLRYVVIEGGINFNLLMIQTGFAYEYTYDLPYKYQTEFKEAQKQASSRKIGLWGEKCEDTSALSTNATLVSESTLVSDSNSCTIKGNISSSGEKIFHTIGCGSYNKTVIDEGKGEKWFCSEKEAVTAGWRKALNCN